MTPPYPTNQPPNSNQTIHPPPFQALIADSLLPGNQLSKMLADILLDSSGLTVLDLGGNAMDDAAVAGCMEALGINEDMQIQVGAGVGVYRQSDNRSHIESTLDPLFSTTLIPPTRVHSIVSNHQTTNPTSSSNPPPPSSSTWRATPSAPRAAPPSPRCWGETREYTSCRWRGAR
jgi:hypothetical protein